jgi:hypothetical protein
MRVRKCSVTKALPKSAVAFAVCAVGLSTTLLSGCNPAPEDAPKHAQQASVDKPESVKQQEDKRLVAFIEARFDRLVAQSPNLQSYLGPVDLCCIYFTQQYMGSHIIENASDTMLA